MFLIPTSEREVVGRADRCSPAGLLVEERHNQLGSDAQASSRVAVRQQPRYRFVAGRRGPDGVVERRQDRSRGGDDPPNLLGPPVVLHGRGSAEAGGFWDRLRLAGRDRLARAARERAGAGQEGVERGQGDRHVGAGRPAPE